MSAYRLTFLLPGLLALKVLPGRHQPCLHGCVLTVESLGRVVVTGRSREQLFEQTRRFLRVVAKGAGPLAIASVLETPLRHAPSGRDGWSIIVGADVAFSPTSLKPDIGRLESNMPAGAA